MIAAQGIAEGMPVLTPEAVFETLGARRVW